MIRTPSEELCGSTLLRLSKKPAVNAGLKIVAFALFENLDDKPGRQRDSLSWFVDGAIPNIKDAKIYFPQWVVRFYVHNMKTEVEDLLLTAGDNVEVVRCSSKSPLTKGSSSRKMMSRFLAIDDPKAEIVIVRDSDSRFSARELLAVNEWIGSGLYFHVMRDAAEHNTEVLGGMFGMKKDKFWRSTRMSALIQQALKKNSLQPYDERGYGEDQIFLSQYVWPRVKAETLAHDSNRTRCEEYGSKICRGFFLGPRSDRDNFFVGAAFKPSYGVQHHNGMIHYACNLTCYAAAADHS